MTRLTDEEMDYLAQGKTNKWDAKNGHKRIDTALEKFREKVEKIRAERVRLTDEEQRLLVLGYEREIEELRAEIARLRFRDKMLLTDEELRYISDEYASEGLVGRAISELKQARAEIAKLRERLRENQTARENYYEGRIKTLSALCLKQREQWTEQDRFNHGVCTSGILGG